MPVAQICY